MIYGVDITVRHRPRQSVSRQGNPLPAMVPQNNLSVPRRGEHGCHATLNVVDSVSGTITIDPFGLYFQTGAIAAQRITGFLSAHVAQLVEQHM